MKLQETHLSTEEKIKNAAAKVFQQKGFAATRTREIADEAGLNLALINYYFRSKKNLFDLIMSEKLIDFFKGFIPLVFNEELPFEEKITLITHNYINLLSENPELPIFVLNAVQNDPRHFSKLVEGAELLQNSPFEQQLKQINPHLRFEHFFMNIMGLCIFPFVMKPAITQISPTIGKEFDLLMQERLKLIPLWIDAMIKTPSL